MRSLIHMVKPATKRIAPATDREMPNGTPAATDTMPTPMIMGPAVGRGILIPSSPSGVFNSSDIGGNPLSHPALNPERHQIHYCEHHNPYTVDKVPVPGHQLHAGVVLFRKLAPDAKNQNKRHYNHTHRDVQGVKADERIKRRSEQVSANRQAMRANE